MTLCVGLLWEGYSVVSRVPRNDQGKAAERSVAESAVCVS
jgi:hypothetical protein